MKFDLSTLRLTVRDTWKQLVFLSLQFQYHSSMIHWFSDEPPKKKKKKKDKSGEQEDPNSTADTSLLETTIGG